MKPNLLTRGWNKLVPLFLILLLITYGCRENGINDPGNEPNNPPPGNDLNILKTIQDDENFTMLRDLVEETDLSATLSGDATLTFFAPTDEAFAALPAGYIKGLTAQQKKDLLRYHLYDGKYQILNEIKRESVATLQGDPLFIEIGQSFGNLVNNRAKIVGGNRVATNGLIHAIDAVLLPDKLGTLADNIGKRYMYRNFHKRLVNTGVENYLNKPGAKTLLTTSDAALEMYENAGMNYTDEQWKEIMQYHVLNVDITVTGPGTRMALATLSGDSVYLTVDYPGQYKVNAGFEPYEVIKSTNGSIVQSTGIMLPDKYLGVLTILDKRYNYTTMRAAIAVARITGRLYNSDANADETFTLFVAKNNAPGLNSLPDDQDELVDLMKYHVLLEKRTADGLQHNQAYTTWQGEAITVTKNGDQTLINGNATIRQSYAGKNGVIYVLDKLLAVPAD